MIMNINEIITNLLIFVVTALATYAIKALVSYLNEKAKTIKSEELRAIINSLISSFNDSARMAVAVVETTFVKVQKEAGTWNAETKQKAFELAKEQLLKTVVPQALDAVEQLYPDVDQYIKSIIEKNVAYF